MFGNGDVYVVVHVSRSRICVHLQTCLKSRNIYVMYLVYIQSGFLGVHVDSANRTMVLSVFIYYLSWFYVCSSNPSSRLPQINIGYGGHELS